VSDGRKSGMNWAQVRERIDRGQTGDKIAVEDPAAAPLGTDAEAGGCRTDEQDIARAQAQRGTTSVPRRALVGLAFAAIAAACGIAAIALALAR
jgi:hypothetical protein